jgi:serine/threonine protein kinase
MNMRTFPFERVKDVIHSRKYRYFLEGNLEKFWPAEPSTSPEFKKLVMRMLVKDPSSRISLDEVIGDPWTIKDELPNKEEFDSEVERCARIVQG